MKKTSKNPENKSRSTSKRRLLRNRNHQKSKHQEPRIEPLVVIDAIEPKKSTGMSGLFSSIRASFLSGLAVIVPLWITGWLIWTVISFFDNVVIPLMPYYLKPQNLLGHPIAGYGLIVFIVSSFLIGLFAKHYLGRIFLNLTEFVLKRLPIVRSIYLGSKQLTQAIFIRNEKSFEKACIIEYPRRGLWAVGFIASETKGEVAQILSHSGQKAKAVFLPTTPNPTSGFMLFVPENDIKELKMSFEDAAKLVISAGLVYPDPCDEHTSESSDMDSPDIDDAVASREHTPKNDPESEKPQN